MSQVKSTYQGTIAGGPSLSVTETFEASAYDRVNVDVDVGATTRLQIAPEVQDALLLLIIKPDKPGPGLQFQVNDSGPWLPLDRSQLFSGAAGLLSHNPLESVAVRNDGVDVVNVDVTVARNAVTSVSPGSDGAPSDTTAEDTGGGTSEPGGESEVGLPDAPTADAT